jgi:predicted adenylyl cyclase CyaB
VSGVNDETEVKARVPDLKAFEAALAEAGASIEFSGEMTDHRFDRKGRLADKDEMLRLRVYRPQNGSTRGELCWKGPVEAKGEYRHRPEIEFAVGDPWNALALLDRLGFSEALRIERMITVYRLGAATLRIERYPEMDVLVEVEGDPEAIEKAIAVTGVPRDEFVPESLPEFVSRYEKRTGRRARLAT